MSTFAFTRVVLTGLDPGELHETARTVVTPRVTDEAEEKSVGERVDARDRVEPLIKARLFVEPEHCLPHELAVTRMLIEAVDRERDASECGRKATLDGEARGELEEGVELTRLAHLESAAALPTCLERSHTSS